MVKDSSEVYREEASKTPMMVVLERDFKEFCQNRAVIYKFLSEVLKDEVPKEFLEKLKGISEKIGNLLRCISPETFPGFRRLKAYVEKIEDVEKEWKELRYEYADLFLNAGLTPVFPYESVYVKGEPLLNQKPVFEVRDFYTKAGVHKSDDYADLDDHIAVELEFMSYLCRNCEKDGFLILQGEFAKRLGWMKEFADNLENNTKSEFYKAIARILRGFISIEVDIAENIMNAELPEKSFIDAIAAISELFRTLEIEDGFSTIKEGVKDYGGEKIVRSHCYICGALCGITVHVKDGIITKVSGLPGDPKGDGIVCPKGASGWQLTYSAYRLKSPLIREGDRFRKATWDEALDKVAELMLRTEPNKVAWLRGNDWNNWLTEAVMKAYGAIQTTHRPMCDNAIRMANEHNLNDKRPWIDYRESDYIILWGINELATSYGRRKVKYLREALKRGAKLVVIDTRRTETAELAHEWIAPKPGTDAAIAMAMCYVIVKNELYDKEFVENWTYGFEDFKKRLLGEEDGIPRTPEWAEKISGVPAKTIERIALEFANAEHPAVMIWAGIAQNPNGFYATQAIMALNALKGTFDAPGGPQLPFKRKLKKPFVKEPPNNSKAKPDKLKMWEGFAPAFFPRDVAEGKFKALFCYYGDPVLSWSNEDAVVDAIKKLDWVVVVDAFMNNTALLADVILPDCTYLERDQIKADWLYDAFIAGYFRAIEPMFESKPEWWIFIQLARRLGYGEFFPWDDIEDALRKMLEGTPWSYEELKEKGYIITDKAEYYKYKKWGSFNPPEGYGSSGKTKTGRYNFKNPVAEEKGIDPLPDYKPIEEEYPELVPDEEYPFIMQNFRILEHEHCSTLNAPHLMKLRGQNPVWINPVDAKKLGIKTGDAIIVESPWGKVEATAYVTWNIREGVVAAAGGFGHWRGLEADPRFPQYRGFNVAKLMPPNIADHYGGNPLLKYIKVKIRKM